jgi:hypothetical protein|tara:strand:+ start:153 stop:647 length:495 start_codon:yes stop_codon:yes gene_type:complete
MDKQSAIKQLGNNPSVAHQQALVQKLTGPKINKQIKMIIPGGASLTEDVSKDQLSSAIFTWLRRCRHFKDVIISFPSDLNQLSTDMTLVVDFNQNNKSPEWEVQGKKWLSERVSDVLAMNNVIGVKVDRAGIHAILDADQSFSAESPNWEPHLIFTPNKPSGGF